MGNVSEVDDTGGNELFLGRVGPFTKYRLSNKVVDGVIWNLNEISEGGIVAILVPDVEIRIVLERFWE